jgi:iron complex outermembrane receptor protein
VALLNASLGIASLKHGWTVSAWCQNCTDQRYYTISFPVPLQTGTEGAYVGRPRMYGLSLTGHF